MCSAKYVIRVSIDTKQSSNASAVIYYATSTCRENKQLKSHSLLLIKKLFFVVGEFVDWIRRPRWSIKTMENARTARVHSLRADGQCVETAVEIKIEFSRGIIFCLFLSERKMILIRARTCECFVVYGI